MPVPPQHAPGGSHLCELAVASHQEPARASTAGSGSECSVPHEKSKVGVIREKEKVSKVLDDLNLSSNVRLSKVLHSTVNDYYRGQEGPMVHLALNRLK